MHDKPSPARVSRAALLALVAVASACGSGGSGTSTGLGTGSSSGVDASKRAADLNDADRAKLCDYVASQYGGYGEKKVSHCDGGTVTLHGPESQSACVADASKVGPGCTATVGEFEACVAAIASADPCTSRALPSACAPLATAACGLGVTGG